MTWGEMEKKEEVSEGLTQEQEEAVRKSIPLWRFLAATGERDKLQWDGWGADKDKIRFNCYLCEYAHEGLEWDSVQEKQDKQDKLCLRRCPLAQKFGICHRGGQPFGNWQRGDKTSEERKVYAQQLLEQLEQLVGTKTYYKGFRVEDGELKSIVRWRDRPEGVYYLPRILTYTEGEVTYAPSGTQGIFLQEELAKCMRFVNTECDGHHAVIHEVTPQGAVGKGWSNFPVCPAVLVGKKVWETNAPPEPRWVDVTADCELEWCHNLEDLNMILINHAGEAVAILGLEGYGLMFPVTGYRVEKVYQSSDCGWWFKVMKEEK